MGLMHDVPILLHAHESVRAVRLVGSRARAMAGPLSDWDFVVTTDDPSSLASNLPTLLAELNPLAFVPDPIAHHVVVAVILPGPVKVDVILDSPHAPEPPWSVRPETLPAINAHFWDWALWLAGKQIKGDIRLLEQQFNAMHRHLLEPLGVGEAPASLAQAVQSFTRARASVDERLRVAVPRTLESMVLPVLAQHELLST